MLNYEFLKILVGIMKILGIDLAGKEENQSGLCILDDLKMEYLTNYTNQEIINTVNNTKPSLIVIDAPLSLPKGRCCLEKECKCAVGGHFRMAERQIRKYGRILPLTFTGMKMLTLRGIYLSSILRTQYTVIESHPRTSSMNLGIVNPIEFLNKISKVPLIISDHEIDAGILTITGYLYQNNCFIELGDPDEGTIILPKNPDCLNIIKK
jgi:predicted nuclease with RNAse H fold